MGRFNWAPFSKTNLNLVLSFQRMGRVVALVLVLPLLANVGGEEEGDKGKQGEDILKLLQIQFIHFSRRWEGGGEHLPHTRD